MSGGHLAMLIMDSLRANPLFRAPLSPKAQHILDVGTGPGEWYVLASAVITESSANTQKGLLT